MELKRKTFLIDGTMEEKMELLRKHNSFINLTEVFRLAINELYNNTFDYKYKPNPLLPTTATTEETAIKNATIKAKAKHVAKKTAEDLRLESKVNMCNTLLGGEVVENPDGSKVCVFTQYTLSGDNSLRVPLAQVDPIIAETSLFMPSKAAIFKNRPEVKKHYEKLNPEETKA